MSKTDKLFNKGEIIIYQTSEKEVELQVRFEGETVWLDAHQIALLFGVNRPAIVKHINNIYNTSELERKSTCSILEQVAADGKIRKIRNKGSNLSNGQIIFDGKSSRRIFSPLPIFMRTSSMRTGPLRKT